MNNEQLIRRLLNKHWPDECLLAGSENLSDILSGDVIFEAPQSGYNVDQTQVVALLIIATQFITAAINLYVALRKSTNSPPSAEQLQAEVDRQGQATIDGRVKLDVCVSICCEFDNNIKGGFSSKDRSVK